MLAKIRRDLDERFLDPNQPVGTTRRYATVKGKRAALCVTRTPSGWAWYDHREDRGGFRPLQGMPVHHTLGALRGLKTDGPGAKVWDTATKLRLPPDMTHDLPVQARTWLYRAHLSDEVIRDLRIGWSPSMQRVIIPVYDDRTGQLIFWQGRDLSGKKGALKYINLRIPKRRVYFWRRCKGRPPRRLVVVEDVLSATRVFGALRGTHTDTVALLGAYIPDDFILDMRSEYPLIILWLDWDKRTKVASWVVHYRMYGSNIRTVMTHRDPKHLLDTEIQEHFREVTS